MESGCPDLWQHPPSPARVDPRGRCLTLLGEGCPLLETPQEALDVLEELAYGGPVGGDGVAVGVWDAFLAWGPARVLHEGVEPVGREVREVFAERRNVARTHGEHEVGL